MYLTGDVSRDFCPVLSLLRTVSMSLMKAHRKKLRDWVQTQFVVGLFLADE